MPPFGKEGSEPSARPLPFLSLSHARPSRDRRRPSKAFGSERAEGTDGGPKRVSSSSARGSTPSSVTPVSRLPFHDEGEEPDQPEHDDQPSQKKQRSGRAPKHVPALFGDEPDEFQPDSDEQSDTPGDFQCTSSSAFSLGWQSMLNLKQADFWKKNQEDQTVGKQKRAYDNSKREASALYLNKDKAGSYRKSGSDPERLQSLLKNPMCRCAMDAPFVFVLYPQALHGLISMVTGVKLKIATPAPQVLRRIALQSSPRPRRTCRSSLLNSGAWASETKTHLSPYCTYAIASRFGTSPV